MSLFDTTERVNIIFGPPGTGKTHSLMGIIDTAMQRGIQPEEIAFISFTKVAVREAVDRACEKFNLSHQRFPYFRTLHSIAFRQLGLKHSEVMSASQFKQFGDLIGVDFTGKYNEATERVEYNGQLGDHMLRMYAMMKAKKISMEAAYYHSGQLYEFTMRDFKAFYANLIAYKNTHHLLDFTDFIDECKNPLPVKLFILDEAQDFNNQQWDLAKVLGHTSERVWIAGDDDQAIFTWAGAEPTRLIGMKGNRIVLPQSYRLRKNIFDFVQSLSSNIKVRMPKDWKPNGEGGNIHRLLDGQHKELDITKGNYLLLARHRWLLGGLKEMARQQGRLYTFNGVSVLESDMFRAVILYNKLLKGQALFPGQIELIGNFIRDFEFETTYREYSYDEIDWPHDGRPEWYDALNGLSVADREYIRSCRRNGENFNKKPEVHISSIHQAKGSEGDNVILLSNCSRRVKQEALVNPDPEWRVWYTAASRAKNNLYIAGGDEFV